MNNEKIVSFIDEPLILVDVNDKETGFLSKEKCHVVNGVLHRAFSIFLFNDKKELLLQKRSSNKLLWPNYWSNTVCSHPRKGETLELATQRRLDDELGIHCNLKFLFKFQYSANYKNIGSENELCHVYVGKHNGIYYPNPNEISDLIFIPFEDVLNEKSKSYKYYTPWFKIEWNRINKEFLNEIINL